MVRLSQRESGLAMRASKDWPALVCRRLVESGLEKGKQVKLYDDRFELLCDPFVIAGTLVVVDAIEVKSGRFQRVRVPPALIEDIL
jgi:hypothetical protein